MPNRFSDNPFDTVTPYNQDPASRRGFAAGAMNSLESVTVPPEQRAEDRLRAAGFTPGNQPWSQQSGWQDRLLEAARGAQGLAANPYDENYANQARAAQMALVQQMRDQMSPSLAGLQGQRGMAQAGQQALMQRGRAGMLGAQGASTGMAGDMGQARLAEVMRAQAGMGGVVSGARGGDQRSALQSAAAQLEAQKNKDALYRFYAGLGTQASLGDLKYGLDKNRLAQGTLQGAQAETDKTWNQLAQALASLVGMGVKGG
jgi:hypothetical protein